jgi:hypothetical protein
VHSLGPIQAAILRKGAAQKYQVKQRPHVLLGIVHTSGVDSYAETRSHSLARAAKASW